MIFPCRGGKHHKCYGKFGCQWYKSPRTLYADNKPFTLTPNWCCKLTRKPWYCDWKRMFKFWITKWFSKDEKLRCRRLCAFCEFRKEYYGDCIFDLTNHPYAPKTYKYAEKRRRELKKSNRIFGIIGVLLLGIGIGGAAMLKTTEITVRTETVQNDIRPVSAEQHTLPYQDFRSNIMRYHYDMYSSQWAYDLSVADAQPNPYEPFIVECSAYCYNGRCTASGKPTIEGVTIAGKREWLGRTALLYEVNDDGGIGEFIGYREFTDTGYGTDSTLYPGYGTIQTGECVDLYFDDEQTALEWGRRKIYIQVINGCG